MVNFAKKCTRIYKKNRANISSLYVLSSRADEKKKVLPHLYRGTYGYGWWKKRSQVQYELSKANLFFLNK